MILLIHESLEEKKVKKTHKELRETNIRTMCRMIQLSRSRTRNPLQETKKMIIQIVEYKCVEG
jgi:hypothetical protein